MNEVNILWSVTFALWSDGAALLLLALHQKSIQQADRNRILQLTRKFLFRLVIQTKLQFGKKIRNPRSSFLYPQLKTAVSKQLFCRAIMQLFFNNSVVSI